jgi:uncharacterized protein YndB with AHSA1/START domain
VRAPRAVADVTAGLVLATVDLEVSIERAFRALTSDEVARWWGSDDTYRVLRWQADLRVGGRWRSEGVGKDGQPFAVGGEYLALEPPRLVVMTWRYEWGAAQPTTLSYRLQPLPQGVRLTVRHEGFGAAQADCEAHAEGWEGVLGWLASYAR